MHSTADFDRIITRRGTGSIKWDRFPDLDPYWVADMDFMSPACVLEALQSRVSHGIMGYAQPHTGLVDAIRQYMESRHGLQIAETDVVHLGGLVPALSIAARAFGSPGDAVMTCTPIYPPFLSIHQDAGMELISIPHVFTEGQWTFDWDAMEASVTDQTKIFLLSNPQNPLGRVFSGGEIERLLHFCQRHDMILVSDEIHCDLILEEEKTPHVCAAGLPDEFQDRIITLLSPSKTYNIAGLGYALAIIKDDKLRRKFCAARGHTLPEINCLAYYAAESAYKDGNPWRLDLIAYLRKNRDTLITFIRERMPGLITPEIEATYLAWIDCRSMQVENPAKLFEKEAGLYLSDGSFFGNAGHVRFNFGCPHSRVIEGLEKMAKVVE
ncbi:MAG: MalY/PatB family protein [Akkermansiaceae bacterium]